MTDKPSLIKVSTLIGYGSPNKADTHDVHGAPLGPDETAATRENLKWEHKEFDVPQEVYDVMRSSVPRGASAEEEWNATFAQYKAKYPKEAEELEGLIRCRAGKSNGFILPVVPVYCAGGHWSTVDELATLSDSGTGAA